jgi:hypothetical protein
VNPRKDDVSTFSFNLNDSDVSSHFVRNVSGPSIKACTFKERNTGMLYYFFTDRIPKVVVAIFERLPVLKYHIKILNF